MNKKTLLPIFIAFAWISASEFIRNQLIFRSLWTDHYNNLGLNFPMGAINGALWGVWSILFAVLIFVISRKFSIKETVLIAWSMAFVMMWIVIGNLSVLPVKLLLFAVPLSLLETYIATAIINKFRV